MNKKEYALAIAEFTKAIEVRPDFIKAYFNRALALCAPDSKDADLKKAMEDVNSVIQLDPDHDGAYNVRGSIHAQWKQYEKALQDMNKAIELKPNDAIRYKLRSVIYRSLKQPEKAMADMEKYRELGGK